MNIVTKRRRVVAALVAVLLMMFLAEGVARITDDGPDWVNPFYVEISGEFAEFDSLVADWQSIPGPMYYDEFLYGQRPFSSTHVNFTDYYSARWTPDSAPLAEAEHIVWAFGGSTMVNIGTTDRLTIANTWARIFNGALGPTHVKNFGTESFISSYELIKFQRLLREVPEDELPTMAIFYDGYNDAVYGFQYGPGSPQKDLSLKLQAFIEQDDFATGLYAASRALSRYSWFWKRTGGSFIENWLFPLPEPQPESANLEAAVRVYTSNVTMTQAICQAFEIRCYFVLQPLIMTKQPLSQVEQTVLERLEAHPQFGPEGIQFIRDFYEMTAQELADNTGFIDASHILDGQTQSYFYDTGHVAAQSPPIIATEIANLILARLDATAA